MLQDKRRAIVLDGETPVDIVVLAPGDKGDKTLSEHANWIEVTGLSPMPGVGNGWTYVDGVFVPPPVPEPTRETLGAERRLAYRDFSDSIFFEWQRGDATEQDWLDAVQAVKDRFPYPEGS